MSSYCTAPDLYAYGVPRGGLPNPARLIVDSVTGSDVLTLDNHALTTGDEVQFRAEAGGTLPAPIAAGTTLYAIRITDSTFSVGSTLALALAGTALNITGAATNTVLITPLPYIDAIEWASGVVDNFLPAHIVPLTAPYPSVVVACAADLAASRMLSYVGGTSVDIAAKLSQAQKMLDRWAKAIPLRGENAPITTANGAVFQKVSGLTEDKRGWDGGL